MCLKILCILFYLSAPSAYAARNEQAQKECPFILMKSTAKKWYHALPFINAKPNTLYFPSVSTDYKMLETFKFGEQSFPQRNMTAYIPPTKQFVVDAEYLEQMAIRQRLFNDGRTGHLMMQKLAGDDVNAAGREVLEMVVESLRTTYPEQFVLGHGILWNKATEQKWNVVQPEIDPLALAGQLVQEDLVLVMNSPGKQNRLAAGFLAGPSMWSLNTWLGKSLTDIHTNVSSDQAKVVHLTNTINNLVGTLEADNIVLRNNWHIYFDPTYAQPSYHLSTYFPRRITRKSAGDTLFVRIERQTLRRLPRTGFVLFTIRVYNYKLSDIAARPAIAANVVRGLERYLKEEGRPYSEYHEIIMDYLKPSVEQASSIPSASPK